MSKEFDVSKVEFTPISLKDPKNMFKVYQQFCTAFAEQATNGHLIPRLRSFYWVDFDKATSDRYVHIDPIDCIFGEIWGVCYFRYQISFRIRNGDIFDEMIIDLRDNPFKDIPLIKSRRETCHHETNQRALYWETGGGGAFMEDGKPHNAVVCEHCLHLEMLGGTKPVMEEHTLNPTFMVHFRRLISKLFGA